MISSQARYDHFDTLPFGFLKLYYYTPKNALCQVGFMKKYQIFFERGVAAAAFARHMRQNAGGGGRFFRVLRQNLRQSADRVDLVVDRDVVGHGLVLRIVIAYVHADRFRADNVVGDRIADYNARIRAAFQVG